VLMLVKFYGCNLIAVLMVIKMRLGLIAQNFVDTLWQSNMIDDRDIDGKSINNGFSHVTRYL
jgi:hypothetical protein